MLLEFSCSNHRSIKEDIKFSMIAGSDNTSEELLMEYGNYKVLRSAVIYGANGSGKSNFIDAISFACNMVGNSINHQPGQMISQKSHKLCDKEIPSEYHFQFVKNGTRYAYGFAVKNNKIDEEYLYHFPNGRQAKIFERKAMDIKAGDKYKKAFEVSSSVLKENRLLLSCAANFSNVKEVIEAFMFFKEDIVVYNKDINNWMEYSIETMQSNKETKDTFIKIMQALGTGIKDVKVKLEKVNMQDVSQELMLPDEVKTLIASREGNRIEAKTVYDDFEVDLITEESTGIKRLFQMICPIIDILNNGKILICDELESSLHESIIYQVILLFQQYKKEKFAQLIFSTHDTSLLSSDIFRRDQVWFTELNNERATNLYSLVEIRNVRKTENLEKGYVSGKYGAIPMLNKNFIQEL